MKIFIIVLGFFIFTPEVTASEKMDVELVKCVDGDTARFKNIITNEEMNVRFLAVDTPETNEELGVVASEFTCDKLTTATTIELEFDSNADLKDKYDRYLAWIFVDGKLLQEELIKEDLAVTAYLYDEYKYTDILLEEENNSYLGIYVSIIAIILIGVVIFLFIKKSK